MVQNCGFGAFCFPFITIGDEPKKIAETHQADGNWIRDILFRVELPNKTILVTDDGMIGILTTERSEALRFLNIVFATAIVENIHLPRLATDLDLFPIIVDNEKNQIKIATLKTTGRNVISVERDTPGQSHRVNLVDRQFIPINKAKEWIHASNHNFTRTEFVDDLLLLADGFSLFLDHSYQASFLFGWMLVETFLDRIWDNYVKTLDRKGDERDNLKNTRNWSAYHHIEVFSMNGRISNNLRETLVKLRKTRNEIIHARKPISREDAGECCLLALDIISNQIHGKDPFYGLPADRQL